MKSKTKKSIILKIFEEAPWIIGDDNKKKLKILSYEMFLNAGLSPTIEYGEKYCDIIYARNIFNQLGYSVLIGRAMYIQEKYLINQ